MENLIYGIDTEKEFNETDVRDAIVRCFVSAHGEILDREIEEYSKAGIGDDSNINKLKEINVQLMVEGLFKKVGGDFEHPDKKALTAVVDLLKEFSLNFRTDDIVEKHHKEIMKLINKLK